MSAIGNWLFWYFGVSGTGSHYGFFSGPGSDLGELAIIGGVYAGLRRINCPITGCWKIGLHHTAAGHRVCRKHHPDDELTVEQAHAAHYAALRGSLVAQYLATRHASQRDAGDNGYAAGHDAEQAMGPVLTPPPGVGDPIYGDSAAAGARARHGHHRRGASRGRGAPEARTGSDASAKAAEDARDPGWPQDGPTEAP